MLAAEDKTTQRNLEWKRPLFTSDIVHGACGLYMESSNWQRFIFSVNTKMKSTEVYIFSRKYSRQSKLKWSGDR